jgi:uncharacterized integral membrane protein
MRLFSSAIKLLLVLIAGTFALKNMEVVNLRYYLGLQWQAPLILVMLAAFALGVMAGVAASLAKIMRLRRELAALRRNAVAAPAPPAVPAQIADVL